MRMMSNFIQVKIKISSANVRANPKLQNMWHTSVILYFFLVTAENKFYGFIYDLKKFKFYDHLD